MANHPWQRAGVNFEKPSTSHKGELVRLRFSCLSLALAVPLIGIQTAGVRADENKPSKELTSFGTLRAAGSDEARGQALAWLKGVGKTDAATIKSFDAIWADANRTVLDRVAKTLSLGDPEA